MKILTYKKQEEVCDLLARLYYLTLFKHDGFLAEEDMMEACDLFHDVALITGAELSPDDTSVALRARALLNREKEDQTESYSCGI